MPEVDPKYERALARAAARAAEPVEEDPKFVSSVLKLKRLQNPDSDPEVQSKSQKLNQSKTRLTQLIEDAKPDNVRARGETRLHAIRDARSMTVPDDVWGVVSRFTPFVPGSKLENDPAARSAYFHQVSGWLDKHSDAELSRAFTLATQDPELMETLLKVPEIQEALKQANPGQQPK